MIATKTKVDKAAFQASIGVLLGVAIVLAAGRTYIRIHIFHRVFVDDVLFFLATVCLVAGTIMVYVDYPYLHTQVSVEAGIEAPPPNFIQLLINDQKIQDSAVVLLSVTIVSVKLSFLFFFRSLLRRLKNLMIWWWCVFAIHIPTAIVMICSSFISCPSFGASILVGCVTPGALARENAVVKAVTILDILTDVLLISIPVLLIWRIKINLRRKITLGAILCLSIFMIITSIIKISAANIVNGQVDTTWVILWLQAEAAVGVIVLSTSAFRALFMVESSKHQKVLHQKHYPHRELWNRSGTTRGRSNKSPSSPHWPWSRSRTAHDNLPSIPSPTMTGVSTLIGHSSHRLSQSTESEGFDFQMLHPGIRVTHELSTYQVSRPATNM